MKNRCIVLLLVLPVFFSCMKDDSPNIELGGGNPPGGNTLAAMITIGPAGYSPATISVKAGTAVTFKNEDNVMHTATADNSIFNTGDIAPGASRTINITAAGTYTYHCNYHTAMTGSLTVTN